MNWLHGVITEFNSDEDVATIMLDDGHTVERWIGYDTFPEDDDVDGSTLEVGMRVMFTNE